MPKLFAKTRCRGLEWATKIYRERVDKVYNAAEKMVDILIAGLRYNINYFVSLP